MVATTSGGAAGPGPHAVLPSVLPEPLLFDRLVGRRQPLPSDHVLEAVHDPPVQGLLEEQVAAQVKGVAVERPQRRDDLGPFALPPAGPLPGHGASLPSSSACHRYQLARLR